MSVLSLSTALSLGEGAVIPAVAGELQYVNETYHGTSKTDGAAYTVQNVILKDGDTTLRAAVWDHPDLTPLKGAAVTLSSIKVGNGKLNGLTLVMGRSYTDKKTGEVHPAVLELKVGKAAIILPADSVAATVATVVTNVNPVQPLPGSINEAATLKAGDKVGGLTVAYVPPAKPSIEDYVALFGICCRAAKATLPIDGSAVIEGSTLQAIASSAATLYISCNQSGLALGCARRAPSFTPAVVASNENPF